MAEGANAEFGRSSGGFVNVVTKSGTNDLHGTLHAYFKDDALASAAQEPGRLPGRQVPLLQQQFGFTLGGPIVKDKAFYFVALDYQNGDSTKQTDPEPHRAAGGRLLREHRAARTRTAPSSAPTTRGSSSPRSTGTLSQQHLATVRYNYTWSEQKNGTFDVDSWGTSANAIEDGLLPRRHAARSSRPSPRRSSTSSASSGRGSTGRAPTTARTSRARAGPLPDTAFDFGSQLPLRDAVLHPRRLLRRAHPVQQQRVDRQGPPLDQGRRRVQPWCTPTRPSAASPNGRYIFGSTDGFLNYAQNPSYVECSDGSTSQAGTCPAGARASPGPVLLFLQQAGSAGSDRRGGRHPGHPPDELAVFLQDKWQPTRNLTVQYGLRWEVQKQADPITPPSQVFYNGFIGQTVTNGSGTFAFPSDGTIPSDYQMWQPPRGRSRGTPRVTGRRVVRRERGASSTPGSRA